MSRPTLSIVMPAYNEETRLPAVIRELAATIPRAVADAGFELVEVVVVDDGSDDGTAAVLDSANDDLLRPLPGSRRNAGKGRAVATGVAAARGEFVLISDVDLATPMTELSALGARLEAGADAAIASRALPGAVVAGTPLRREWMGRAFNRLMRLATGLPFLDTQCGFKLLPTDAARALLAVQIAPGYAFDVELLMRARAAGLRVDEVAVRYVHHPDSRVRALPAAARMARDVIRLTWALRIRGPRGCPAAAGRTPAPP